MTAPPLRRAEPEGGSSYVHPVTGERYWSVTTVLGGGVPKPALVPWASKLVAEHVVDHYSGGPVCAECNRLAYDDDPGGWIAHLKGLPNAVRDRRAAEGSAVHHVIADLDAGTGPDPHEHHDPVVRAWAQWFEDYTPRVLASETTVFNHWHRYAGTLDAIVEIEGLGTGLVDYKTGSGFYPEVALQLAAYRHADAAVDADGTERPMPETSWGGVLLLDPGGAGYQFREVDVSLGSFEAFLSAWNTHDFLRRDDWLRATLPTPRMLAEASDEEREVYAALRPES